MGNRHQPVDRDQALRSPAAPGLGFFSLAHFGLHTTSSRDTQRRRTRSTDVPRRAPSRLGRVFSCTRGACLRFSSPQEAGRVFSCSPVLPVLLFALCRPADLLSQDSARQPPAALSASAVRIRLTARQRRSLQLSMTSRSPDHLHLLNHVSEMRSARLPRRGESTLDGHR